MQEIDLNDEVVYNVKVGGKSYELREPTVDDIKDFQDSSRDGSEIDSFLNFIVTLGMPKTVAKTLGITKIRRLANGITEGLEEKK